MSETTNATIKYFYRKESDIADGDINISSILNWKENCMTLDRNDLFYLAIQGKEDRYSRTLGRSNVVEIY